jgi:arsenite/tail-anchored protein-transporting ATPase
MGQEVYGDLPVTDVLYRDDPIRVRRRSGGYVLTMRLPFVSREDMDIHRRGEELYVRVGTYKRNLILPQTLQRMEVRGANFVGDHLEIVFARQPGAVAPGGRSGRG